MGFHTASFQLWVTIAKKTKRKPIRIRKILVTTALVFVPVNIETNITLTHEFAEKNLQKCFSEN